jgi:anti-sigma-K factor RskA
VVSQEIFSVATRGSTQRIEERTALECRRSRRTREYRARWKDADFWRKRTAAVPETDQLFAETVARHGLKCSGVIKEEYFAKRIY